MTTYLTVITMVLVLTQIIRVTQNAMQLKRMREVSAVTEHITRVWMKIEKYIDSKENE